MAEAIATEYRAVVETAHSVTGEALWSAAAPSCASAASCTGSAGQTSFHHQSACWPSRLSTPQAESTLPDWLGYRSRPNGCPEMNGLCALAVFVVLVLSACGGADDEQACVLLEDVPDQVEEATLEGVTAVAEAAQDSEVSEFRALGDRLAQNLTRSQVLERIAPGSFLEVVQTDLDDLRRACGDLGSR
jgi:hypothetical protein